jgi:DNA polymerase I
MTAVAQMERTGVPLDAETLAAIRDGWGSIKSDLITEVDTDYGVFENSVFKSGLFAKYLADRGIAWPKTETGRLQLDQDTFRDQAKVYPELAPLLGAPTLTQ